MERSGSGRGGLASLVERSGSGRGGWANFATDFLFVVVGASSGVTLVGI